MAKVAPDYSFVREGVPLGEWLWRLLGPDRADRERAGEAIQAMSYGMPSVHTDYQDVESIPDTASQQVRFAQAVRDAVVAPGFDTAEFVRTLCVYRVASSDDWSRRADERSKAAKPDEEQYQRIADRLIAKINAAVDEATRKDASRRFARALLASVTRDCELDKRMQTGADLMTMASFQTYAVFLALDHAFLTAPEALMLVLEHRQQAHEAIEALTRIGPAASAFVPALIERMDQQANDRDEHRREFDAAGALASIGRDNPAVVQALIDRLKSDSAAMRIAAASTLVHMGIAVAGRTAEILSLLHAVVDRGGDELWAGISALASVGRDDAPSRRRVIEFARPRPARWSEPYYKDHRQNLTMSERGVAIDAMRHLVDYPDECVPVLIDAIDTFEEYDPDASYGGPVARIAYAISHFGARARTAAVPLARHLGDEGEDFPRNILDTLRKIGPAAADALPLLDAYRRERAGDEPLADLNAGPLDFHEDGAGWAIQKIRGG